MKHIHSENCSCKNDDIRLTLGSLIDWSGGQSEMSNVQRKQTIGGIWHDSRKVESGSVFVAMDSRQNDGHNYVDAAFKAGAIAAIVNKKKNVTCSVTDRKS